MSNELRQQPREPQNETEWWAQDAARLHRMDQFALDNGLVLSSDDPGDEDDGDDSETDDDETDDDDDSGDDPSDFAGGDSDEQDEPDVAD